MQKGIGHKDEKMIKNTGRLPILIIDDKPEEVEKAAEALVKVSAEMGYPGCFEPIKIRLESNYNPFNEESHERPDLFPLALDDIRQDVNKIEGLLTDLYYVPVTNKYMVGNYGDAIPPGGILAVMECARKGIPAVICTDADDSIGHGGLSSSWIIDGLLRVGGERFIAGTECNDYFGLNPKKDWEGASRALITMIKERGFQ